MAPVTDDAGMRGRDAAFIAAANPEVVRALVHVVRCDSDLLDCYRNHAEPVCADVVASLEDARAALASILAEGGEG